MSARVNFPGNILALALLSLTAQSALAGGAQITQPTKAGLIQVIKGDTSAEFKLENRLLYRYTQGYCAGIQWHGHAGADEVTLVYASTCGNGVYPSWRLIVVKPDGSIALTGLLGDFGDLYVSQLGDRLTFADRGKVAAIYQPGGLTINGRPSPFAAIPTIE